MREKFIVLDVEGGSACRPYNVGFIIADRYGRIYKRYSFALPECIWENVQFAVESGICLDMTKANIQEILTECGSKKLRRKYKMISIEKLYSLLIKLIKRFKISRLFAYNVTFDKNSLLRLFGQEKFEALGLEYCDIITGILNTRLLTKEYCQFCIDNGFVTEKGNIQTKAEVVYKYLTNCLDFVEEHTGLSDVLIEYEILLTAFRSHGVIDFAPCQAWRKLKKFCEEGGIA